jgi:hypothetical protein
MEEIILCPDIHCRNFWKPILDIKDKKIIFLGDYLDPYPSEGYTFKNGLDNLKIIIELKKKDPDRITLLLGNHCCNSLWQKNWASRFQPSEKALRLYTENINLFEPYKIVGNTFFTHAGISEGWYKTHKITDIVQFINSNWKQFLQYPNQESYLPIFDCGRARWGYAPYGGIFWNDLSEIKDNPIDYIQIAGHNQLRQTGSFIDMSKAYTQWKGKPFYCIDSRWLFIWDGEKLETYD